MPTYDYRCKKCGKAFEINQSMSEPMLKKCPRPKCSGVVERLIGAGAGFIFKGTGFYQTDYKKSTPSEKKSDAKPEVKSESKPKESSSPAPAKEKPKKSDDKA